MSTDHFRRPSRTQASYLMAIRRWFRWLAEQKIVPEPVGDKLELPKEERRLPTDVLTASEVESVLNQADITRPLGIRNRAILRHSPLRQNHSPHSSPESRGRFPLLATPHPPMDPRYWQNAIPVDQRSPSSAL